MQGFYLTIISSATFSLDAPLIELLIDGEVVGSFTEDQITNSGTSTHNFFVEYDGLAPSSISARINDTSTETGREITFDSFLINGRDIRDSVLVDGQGQSENFVFTDQYDFNTTDTDWLYGQTTPTFSAFGSATYTGTAGNDFVNGSYIELDIIELGDGNDVANGNQGDDVIFGGTGNDRLIGAAGHDVLVGGSGRDELRGQLGDDIIYGGDDNDWIYGNEGNDTLNGGAGNDRINGFDDNDIIYGEDGNDILNGDAGDDYINGGIGKDFINGGIGNDTIDAGLGDDVIDAGAGDDIVDGGDGNNRIFTYDGADTVTTGTGRDFIRAGDGDDTINSGDNNDTIFGEDGNDTLYGEGGQDSISGGLGDDFIDGGDLADNLYGNEGNDTIYGGGFNDNVYGGVGTDTLHGGDGSDRVFGGDDNDTIYGDRGFDYLLGENGDDTLHGGLGDDRLEGGSGADTLNGDDGDDILDGGDGNDILNGGTGNDTLYGATIIGESGVVTGQTTSSTDWNTVTFSSSFLNPIVKMSALTSNGDPFVIGVRNVTSTGFQWQIDEFDYLDGVTDIQTLSWLVVEEGTHTLDNGSVIQAGTVTATNEAFTNVTFDSAFGSAPVVMTQVMTDNDAAAVGTRNRNRTASGFQIQMLEEEVADGVHATEDIGWIAIDNAGSPESGFLVGETTNSVNHNVTTIDFGGTFSNIPVFVHDQQTRDGGDTSYSQSSFVTTTNAGVYVGEEQSRDSEVWHTSEVIGYYALNEGLLTSENGGDNTFNGGAGVDTLFGGDGADTFIFEAAHAYTDNDILADFSAGEGDILDISDLISGFNGNINDHLLFDDSSGTDTIVRVDSDGLANGTNYQAIATINGITGLDETTLYNDGNIIV